MKLLMLIAVALVACVLVLTLSYVAVALAHVATMVEDSYGTGCGVAWFFVSIATLAGTIVHTTTGKSWDDF